MQIPADCIILSGQVLINESSLTGESLPIIKRSLDSENTNFQENKINILYCGTQVV